MDEAILGWMPMGFAALLAGAGVVLLAVLRPRWQRAATFAERAQTCLLGWAMAESLSLFGAVYILLSGGEVPLFLAGLGLFFITWWVLPLKAPD